MPSRIRARLNTSCSDVTLHKPIVLRDYQIACIAECRACFARGMRAILLVSPTGSGKTIEFCAITAGAHGKGNRTLLVVHRRELLAQASTKLTLAGVPHGIIAAGFPSKPDALVQLCSIQTIIRRLSSVGKFALIILDEAHHCVAGLWRKLLESQPQARLLGVTATPLQLDGRGLGIKSGGFFDSIVLGPTIKELVADKFLSPCRIFTAERKFDLRHIKTIAGDFSAGDLAEIMSDATIVGNSVAQYRLHADHQPAICFCITIDHAKTTAKAFSDAGYRAAFVSGKTPIAERDALIAGLGNGKVEVLCTCDLVSEGLDVPIVGACILLRPTKSLALFMQQCGRGMRVAPGKKALLILDHVGNCARHGPPDLERIWTLEGLAILPPTASKGEGKDGNERTWTTGDGVLVEISPDRLELIRGLSHSQILGARLSKPELEFYAQHKGYRPGWVYYRLLDQQSEVAA